MAESIRNEELDDAVTIVNWYRKRVYDYWLERYMETNKEVKDVKHLIGNFIDQETVDVVTINVIYHPDDNDAVARRKIYNDLLEKRRIDWESFAKERAKEFSDEQVLRLVYRPGFLPEGTDHVEFLMGIGIESDGKDPFEWMRDAEEEFRSIVGFYP